VTVTTDVRGGLSRLGPAARRIPFTESALTRANAALPSGQVAAWLADRLAANRFAVERVPFAAMDRWGFEADTGNLVHDTGRFFSVEGLSVRTDYGPVPAWTQPIVNQPEVGILGILVKEIDGVLHCLMSAKMEPGNVNLLQISPTVQATRSNYTRAHLGGSTPYLEYFVDRRRGRVIADVLQSEQGAWFHRKANRNMIVEVREDVEAGPEFCWLTVGQLLELMGHDNIVNMDARTVLSCMPFTAAGQRIDTGDPWRAALVRSLGPDPDGLEAGAVLSWITDARARYSLHSERVPLRGIGGWHRTPTEIAHEAGRYFKVIATTVRASNREVASWSQPLVEPVDEGLVALVVARIGGVVHALMHARVEPGYRHVVELAPTVQCAVGNYHGLPASHRPAFLDLVLDAPAESVRYDVLLSEEGGRFYHAQNRYRVVEVADPGLLPVGEDFQWVRIGVLTELLRHSHYLNVQARSLIASLHSLWAGRG
jgi:oxidase EvaA